MEVRRAVNIDPETWRRLCGPYDPVHRFTIPVPDDLSQAPDARNCAHCGKRVVPFDSGWGRLWVSARAVANCDTSPDGGHHPSDPPTTPGPA
ncbi:hypothetical protein [Streptosporangium saharense]|uniref:hypothetical protein n=1 Tax=Streptosporangium saharense TaxID=1706840 RepID=UPI00343C007F